MRHYPSFDNIKYDKFLLGEEIVAENKLDGQNFCARYNVRTKSFIAFGSKKMIVDENNPQFGGAVLYFKNNYENILNEIIKENLGKKKAFNGVDEIHFYFEYYGENSFAGFHDPNDELKLALIDVFLKKKGYLEPKTFYKLFENKGIILPEVIYRGKLTNEFINSINNNDWTNPSCQYPSVKEGVVCKRSTLMKGQRLPMVKVKTNWWLNKLKEKYPDNWKEME